MLANTKSHPAGLAGKDLKLQKQEQSGASAANCVIFAPLTRSWWLRQQFK
jgi:hypothetical protein